VIQTVPDQTFFFCSTRGLLLTEHLMVFLQANVLSMEENFITYTYLCILANVYLKLQTQGNLCDGTHLLFTFFINTALGKMENRVLPTRHF